MWHFTTGVRLFEILKSGYLEPRSEYVLSSEIPVLWFSRHPLWEPMANKNSSVDDKGNFVRYSMKETAAAYGGLFRISAPKDGALRGWPEIAQLANYRPAMIQAIDAITKDEGSNTVTWYGMLYRVPIGELEIEMMVLSPDGLVWKPCPRKGMITVLAKAFLQTGIPLGDDVMTRENPRWKEFAERMTLQLKPDDPCGHEFHACQEVLGTMGMDVPSSLVYFASLGGLCDCEVMMNVIDWDEIAGDEDGCDREDDEEC